MAFIMRILILDAQAGRADTLASSLRVAGHPALGFTRPAEVLAALQEGDILLMNYHMPEMTGLEVARQAYAQGWRGSLLLMSGHLPSFLEEMLRRVDEIKQGTGTTCSREEIA
jgi:CheY-like chemotaxis protein